MNIDRLVEKNYDNLNENDIYIWQYIFLNKEKCQKMSISALAEACNVSSANIMRFAKKLGLDGFSELKVYIKWSLENIPQYDKNTVINTALELHKTLDHLQNADLDEIISRMSDADRIFIYVTGEVQNLMAKELKRKFSYISKHMHIVEDNDEMKVLINSLSNKDLFFIISFLGDNKGAINWVKNLKEKGIYVIGIAQDTNNLLKRNCNSFLGFVASKFYTGLSDVAFTCTSHFFTITDMIFVKYLEYINKN